jgi:hypothetical protein
VLSVAIFVHVIAPDQEPWIGTLTSLLGQSKTVPVEQRSERLRCWTILESQARKQGVLSRLEETTGAQGLQELETAATRKAVHWSGTQIWPLYCFTVDRPLDHVPANYSSGRFHDLLYTGDPLWIHFVSNEDVMTREYHELSVSGGLWGTQEGYAIADDVCHGWFVTQDPRFDAVPAKLHSVF